MIGIIAPKRPAGPGWIQCAAPPEWVTMGYRAEAWENRGARLFVISAVEVATDKDGHTSKGPEYHISISARSQYGGVIRCSSADALWVLAQFGITEAEEDNHVPGGQVRNFWRPVADPLVGLLCECKDDEPAMREDKGDYVWRGT